MRAEQEAVAMTLPAASDATISGVPDQTRTRKFAITAGASTAVIDVGVPNVWVTITSDVDVYVRAGTVSSQLTAAVGTTDWPLFAKAYSSFWIDTDRYLRFYGGADSGSVWLYVSSR